MRVIIVDDEHNMIKSFMRLSKDIDDLNVIASFDSPNEALDFTNDNTYEVAFLDIVMPELSGVELAKKIREILPNVLIVFLTAHEGYIRDSNSIGADYYVLKPYKRETLEMIVPKLKLLQQRQDKSVYFHMFGRFVVLKDGKPIHLVGKAKEILALVATQCGKEISNEDIYSTIWETRAYDNISMKVYYNALKRLKDTLRINGIPDVLFSTARGQMINLSLVDGDYLSYKKEGKIDPKVFDGDFLSEYSWGEYILSEILQKMGYY